MNNQEEIERLTEQRDMLLAALEEIVELDYVPIIFGVARTIACAAIAKAKAKAKAKGE